MKKKQEEKPKTIKSQSEELSEAFDHLVNVFADESGLTRLMTATERALNKLTKKVTK